MIASNVYAPNIAILNVTEWRENYLIVASMLPSRVIFRSHPPMTALSDGGCFYESIGGGCRCKSQAITQKPNPATIPLP